MTKQFIDQVQIGTVFSFGSISLHWYTVESFLGQLVDKANLTLCPNPKHNLKPYCNSSLNLTLTLTSSNELSWGRVHCHSLCF